MVGAGEPLKTRPAKSKREPWHGQNQPPVQSALVALAQDFPDVTFLFLGEGPAQMLHPSAFGWAAAER